MEKIFIFVNHSWPHTGGCEKVVQQISESLHSKFNCECTVFSKSYSGNPIVQNGIIYRSVSPSPQKFLQEVIQGSPDHILVYGDMFIHWAFILNNLNNLKCGKTIALVGMNLMRQNGLLLQKFIKNKDQINVVVHSQKYIDYLMCKHYDIPVNVIPNGITMSEFEKSSFDFRSKYNIDKQTKIILCVSNFFPGKGQEFLIPIIKNVQDKIKDSISIFICSQVNFPFAKILQNRFITNAKNANINFKVLEDISREEVISAFTTANVFAFPSQKEVAPLVLLEAMASKTPWISLPVGNSKELSGGIIIPAKEIDADENFIYNSEIIDSFSKALINVLENKEYSERLILDGNKEAQSVFNFDIIADKYFELFTKRKKNE